VALAPKKGQGDVVVNSRQRNDEIRRLPLFLRMLSASQPLSSIPSLKEQDVESSPSSKEFTTADPLVDQTVSRLENVAASYSAAELVDDLTSNHAPLITRKVSRLRPLKRNKRKLKWDTQDLASVAASPLGPLPRLKRRKDVAPMDEPSGEEISANYDSSLSGDGDDMSIEDEMGDTSAKDTKQANVAAPSDSQEAMTTKGLSEIAKLVVASLEPIEHNKEDEDGFSSLLLPVTNQLISEPVSEYATESVGGCDFGATVSALMHHAPVLRHCHVAVSKSVLIFLDFLVLSLYTHSHFVVVRQNALCRAAAPQAVLLIQSMASNCPSAVPALLRGCIDAYTIAMRDDTKAHTAITNTAKASVRKLAGLSYRESVRVQSVLQQSKVMLDVQLELALEHDPIIAASICNSYFSQCVMNATPDEWFEEKPLLFSKCFTCFNKALSDSRRITGRSIVLLRALSFLSLVGGTWKRKHDLLTPTLIVDACKELVALCDATFNKLIDASSEKPPKSENDDLFCHLLCACLSVHARAILSLENGSSTKESIDKCLIRVFDLPSISLQSDVVLSKFACLLKANRGNEVCHVALEALTKKSGCYIRDKALDEGFLETSRSICSSPNIDSIIERGITDAAAMVDSSALIQYVNIEGSYNELERFVRSILDDASKCSIAIRSDDVCDIIKSCITAVKMNQGSTIPFVLPVQLQALSLKIDWRKGESRMSQPALESKYLLRLLYGLYFYVEEPTSPFVIDPRDLPLKESLELADTLVYDVAVFKSELACLIEQVAPEVSSQISMSPIDDTAFTLGVEPSSPQSRRRAQCDRLSDAVREVRRDMMRDTSGTIAEKSFVLASLELSLSDLIVTAARALLGSPTRPLPFMTYSGLCRDPLVLFKAPLQVWRNSGLRRIALYTLSCLLQANRSIVVSTAFTEEVASELLVCRDTLVVKCLITAAIGGGTGKDSLSPFTDSTLIAMVRGMVAKNVGLVAQLAKEGRNEAIMDWLIQFVPESMQDAESLAALLSERSSLTCAEKLEVAAASLSLAIVHGGQNESLAKALAYASLSRLVSSFFLVVGPVGVPVNALDDEGGKDLTETCRNAAFRILGALQNVRARRSGLQNECGISLQKLANLCKSESMLAGVSGPAANMRKKLLKDIYDAAIKAANAMGTSIKL
jgi:hypothetical protein